MEGWIKSVTEAHCRIPFELHGNRRQGDDGWGVASKYQLWRADKSLSGLNFTRQAGRNTMPWLYNIKWRQIKRVQQCNFYSPYVSVLLTNLESGLHLGCCQF